MLRGTVASAILLIAVCLPVSAANLVNLWLDVPFVPQQKDGCGAAALAMVMQYWDQHEGRAVRPQSQPAYILDALISGKAHGIYASSMVKYLQQNGFHAFAFAGTPQDLERELVKGRPLIAALKPQFGSSLHYVVVVGIDQPQQLVIVNDPAQRKLLKENEHDFEREWKVTGNWVLLAVPESSTR